MKLKILLLTIIFVLSSSFVFSYSLLYPSNIKWSPELEKLAREGSDPYNMVYLGCCYDTGTGVVKDKNQAFELFKKSSSYGNSVGRINLAYYLAAGEVEKKNITEAMNLLNKVIEEDPKFELAALIAMAEIYECERDYKKAFDLWNKIANQKNSKYISLVIDYYINGRGINQDLRKAKELLMPLVEKGDLIAMTKLAQCFKEEKNYNEALKWALKAYESGYKNQYLLGDLYYYGLGVQQDYKKAYELYNEGSVKNSKCKFKAALMLKEGLGVPKDINKAYELLRDAAEHRQGEASYVLAQDFYYGENISQNYNEAFKYLKMTLTDSQYLPDAVLAEVYNMISRCYRFGRGTDIDENIADEYLSMAAELGDVDAKQIIDWLYNR